MWISPQKMKKFVTNYAHTRNISTENFNKRHTSLNAYIRQHTSPPWTLFKTTRLYAISKIHFNFKRQFDFRNSTP